MGRAATIEEVFAKDTSNHVLTVLRDDGVYRHLRYAAPGTRECEVEVTTWPGHLAVTGDMGDWLFARLDDMFQFFRGDKINPSYWAQKCVAGVTVEYSKDALRSQLRQSIAEWTFEHDEHDGDRIAAMYEQADRVCMDAHTEEDARNAIEDAYVAFSDEPGLVLDLNDAYEWDLTANTHHFLWCCWAIVTVIAKYDAAKTATPTVNMRELALPAATA